MADFVFTAGSDFSQVFADLAKVSQGAKQAGDGLGKGLSDGLATANANINALSAQIKALVQTRAKFAVDSSEFKAAQQQIDVLQGKLQQVRGDKLKLQVDATAVGAAAAELGKIGPAARQAGSELSKGITDRLPEINSRLAEIMREIGKLSATKATLKVDSAEYKEAESKIAALRQERSQLSAEKLTLKVDASEVPPAADQFRLLDGVVQGVAFSLSNAVVDGAGRALQAVQGLISGYAKLDTVLRQAAAADGGAGAYDTLASTIDRVGIDAAGTQQEVADLSLELVRGGLTADQVSQSLGGIVRGAEATATAYDRMGQIVSATLTAFGLSATETTRVVDALVQGANSSATDVSGLGEAFKTSAPAAKLLGVSVEGLTTAVGLFTNAGITAGEAGTTLRNGLSQLGSAAPQTGAGMQKLTGQAKEAADVMKVLKLDIYNANGTLKPMETVLLQLKGAFDKLGPAAQIQLASKLFGGTDDGTKWLAVLSQSEDKIKTMAKAMDGAKGATDRNRDAMQGFQLTIQQLTGTLNSLGNNIGRVAATALLPLVNAANAAVGAIAALPGPVKDAVIALGLLAGGVAAATTAYVVFKQVLAMGAVSDAVSEISSLSAGIGKGLVSGIKLAIASLPGLLTQLQLIGNLKPFTISISGIPSAIAGIKALTAAFMVDLKAGIASASASISQFVVYLQSANFASFVAGVRSVVAALAPMAIALAALTVTVLAWQQTFKDSNAILKDFQGAQDQSSSSSRRLEEAVGSLGNQAQQSVSAWQSLLNSLSEPFGVMELAKQTEMLQASMDKGEEAARKFYLQLKNGSTITANEVAQSKAYSTYLNDQSQLLTQVASSMRAKADQAEREGKTELAKQYRDQANALDVQAQSQSALSKAIQDRAQALGKAAGMSATELAMTEEQTKLNNQRIETEKQLNQLIAEAPVRSLDAQLAVGQQLLGLSKSLGDLEQSRYAVTKSALEFELQKAQERGASETQINAIKRQIDQQDQAALSARYQALQVEQALQQAMLQLSQQKARIEADLAIQEQKAKILQAQADLYKAQNNYKQSGSADDLYALNAAQAQVDLQNQILGITQDKRNILDQTQPIERAIAAAQAETARNGEQAKAAAMGFKINADGTLTPLKGIAGAMNNVATLTADSAEEAARYEKAAAAAGLQVGKAKDGTIVLGNSWGDVNAAVETVNQSIDGTAQGADGAKKGAEGVKTALDGTKGNAQALASSFVSTGQNAPAAAQGARDFAAYLSGAKAYGVDISKLNLDTQFKSVATSTGQAATSAQTFYSWLERASRLPGSRWTGGPVEAGGEYRINELGQEAFLSAGRLSLIDAAPNSIWRAPSEGVVIPAGVTASLKARGAVPGAGGAATQQAAASAELAIEVGKLREEVGNLARRDWSVRVTQRTGPTGSQVLRTLLS